MILVIIIFILLFAKIKISKQCIYTFQDQNKLIKKNRKRYQRLKSQTSGNTKVHIQEISIGCSNLINNYYRLKTSPQQQLTIIFSPCP